MGDMSVSNDNRKVESPRDVKPLLSDQTKQALINTLITFVAAAALAAALTGAYLLIQHHYTLVSGFENTIGLTVTSSFVLIASGLTLCVINYPKKEVSQAQGSPRPPETRLLLPELNLKRLPILYHN